MSERTVQTAGARGETEVVEPSDAQRAFARRVAESKATAPHVYFERDLSGGPVELPALVAACGRALREVPVINGAYRDGRFELYSRANVAFAVEAAGTFAFPVVHDADASSAAEIGERIAALTERVRSGEITSPELAGATFTVIEMVGARRFTPVINRGQAATLGAGTDSLILAADNRIAQGSEGGDLLERIISYLG